MLTGVLRCDFYGNIDPSFNLTSVGSGPIQDIHVLNDNSILYVQDEVSADDRIVKLDSFQSL